MTATDTAVPVSTFSVFPASLASTLPDPGSDPAPEAVALGARGSTFSSSARRVRDGADALLTEFRKAVAARAKIDADPMLSAAGRAERFAAARATAEAAAGRFDFAVAAQVTTEAQGEVAAIADRAVPTEPGAAARMAADHHVLLGMQPGEVLAAIASGDQAVAFAFVTLGPLARRNLANRMPRLDSMQDPLAAAVRLLSPDSARRVDRVERAAEVVRESARLASSVVARVRLGAWHEGPANDELLSVARTLRGGW